MTFLSWIRVIVDKRLAWERSWDKIVEDSETVATIRVSHVVAELSQFAVLWANRQAERWAKRIDLSVVPETVSVRACSVIILNDVVGVRDPETGWSLISVEKRP